MNGFPENWRIGIPTVLAEDGLPYLTICADTDDPAAPRRVALVGVWDREGERYARMVAAVPKLLAACQSVVERWEHGDLAEAARRCAAAVAEATGAASSGDGPSHHDAAVPNRERILESLLAQTEKLGLEAEDLDEAVHELASRIAADTNNAGLDSQLGYLTDAMGGQAVSRQLDWLAAAKSVPDQDGEPGETHGIDDSLSP
jgi:hypothetical protein